MCFCRKSLETHTEYQICLVHNGRYDELHKDGDQETVRHFYLFGRFQRNVREAAYLLTCFSVNCRFHRLFTFMLENCGCTVQLLYIVARKYYLILSVNRPLEDKSCGGVLFSFFFILDFQVSFFPVLFYIFKYTVLSV